MSGHSKWHSIKHKKAATDAKRGKIFTKHAKLVAVAARTGGDPNMNPSLRAAIDNARAENMPMENIERAIKKGTGESKDSAKIEEVMYEGFGPGGTALFIESLTDNRNRTISSLKTIMGKKGGTIGEAGSVGYLFQRKGLIVIPVGGEGDAKSGQVSNDMPADELELAAIDAGADDVVRFDDEIHVFTHWQQLMKVRSSLEEAGVKSRSAELIYVPDAEIEVTDEKIAQQILNLIDALEEDDDVSTVFTNATINDEVMEKVGG